MPETEVPLVPRVSAGSGAAGPGTGDRDAPAPQQHLGPQVAELADQLTGRLVGGVGWLKARATFPAVKLMRAVVYGLVALVGLLTAAVLGLVGVVRIWDVYVPVHPLARRVWLGYAVFGAALFLGGAFLLARRAGDRGKT
jgi:hypothetical protein